MIKKICFTAIMTLCVQMANAQVNVQRDYVPDNQNGKPAKEKVEKERMQKDRQLETEKPDDSEETQVNNE